MPVYASRVAVTVPVRAMLEGESTPIGYRCEEVMFDKVKASSQSQAEKHVRKEADRYWKSRWTGDIEEGIAPPCILATCRLDQSGVPVLAEFPLPATASPRVVSVKGGGDKGRERAKVRAHHRKTGVFHKPIYGSCTPPSPPLPARVVEPIFKLSDPFTAELIDAVSIKPKGVK